MTDGASNGSTLKARYEYDPYGKRSANLITTGAVEADFGYTGHFYHAPSTLHLAPYRAYDASLGRWISRDPIGENGGMNLYGYVHNQLPNRTDPFGLYGYETKFWADLSVNGNWAQRAISFPMGILAATVPDAAGVSASGNAGLIEGGSVGVNREWYRSECESSDFSTVGNTWDEGGLMTPQLGISLPFNLAWSSDYNPGASSWAGDFREINVSAGLLTAGYFQGGAWKGVNFGFGVGVPPYSGSNQNVNYQPLP